MSNRGIFITFLVGAILGTNPAYSGEIATGSIMVCRKPMMAGRMAAIRALQAPRNDVQSRQAFRDLQDIQREEQEYCFTVQRVEITGGGEDKIEIGLGHTCREFTGLADGEEVFVAYGSQSKQYGRCP